MSFLQEVRRGVRTAIQRAYRVTSSGSNRPSSWADLMTAFHFHRPRNDEAWLRTFGQNARLSGPIQAMATDVAAVRWHHWRPLKKGLGKAGREEIIGSQVMRLLKRPHPHMTWTIWCYVVQVFLDLVGKAPIYIEWGFVDGHYQPIKLWPFPPHWIVMLPSGNDPFFTVNWFGSPKRISASDVIWMYRPDPLQPFGDGLGLARPLEHEVNQDEYMAKHNSYYFANCAFLGAIVGVPGGGDNLDALEKKWNEKRAGPANAGRTLFVDNESGQVTVNNLAPSPRELQFEKGRRLGRDFMREGFQVPAERLGTSDHGSSRGSNEASDFHQQSKNVAPRLNYLAEGLNQYLCPLFWDYEPDSYLEPENCVRETLEQRRQTVESGIRSGYMTINEARTIMDLEPIPGGDVLLLPVNNIVPMKVDADLTQVPLPQRPVKPDAKAALFVGINELFREIEALKKMEGNGHVAVSA